jgi:hypothetical protein
VTCETSSIKSNNFCGRLRSWAAFISLDHWSLAVHLFAVLSNRKRVYNSLVGLNEKLSYKGISSWSNFARYKSIIIQGVGEWSPKNFRVSLSGTTRAQQRGGGAGGPPQTHPEILGRPVPNTLYCNLQFSEINTVRRRLLSEWD